jgi:predicted phosphodiesterase
MLQLLVCSDIHTYTDNLRLAILKMDRVDAVLIAGDQEAEKDAVLAAAGSLPCYIVCGNNDYYLNTDYPEELLIDICIRTDPLRNDLPADLPAGPVIGKVTELTYDSVPDTGGTETGMSKTLSRLLSIFSPSKKEELPRGLSFPPHTFKRPENVVRRILMTHGKEYNVPDISLLSRRAGIWDADLVIFGHTHQFRDTSSQWGKIRLVNPGCLVGDPRASIRTYGQYEICSFAMLRIGDHGEIDVEHFYL